jgi:hypothetical protein
MGKVWVLDTETKGTGANMVPLEKVLKQPAASREPLYVPPKREPAAPEPPQPAPPPRFRVVDLMTRQVLVDGAGTRATVQLLNGVRSVVDVIVYVCNADTGEWRMLTLEERQTLWRLRDGDARGE